jgi:hypothetical protein
LLLLESVHFKGGSSLCPHCHLPTTYTPPSQRERHNPMTQFQLILPAVSNITQAVTPRPARKVPPPRFLCGHDCDEKFHRREPWATHCADHRNEKLAYVCTVCNGRFSWSSDGGKHAKQFHSAHADVKIHYDPPSPCPVCKVLEPSRKRRQISGRSSKPIRRALRQ